MPLNRKKQPQLWAVFDTSAIHTHVADNLVRSRTRQLVQAHSAHTDLQVRWFLPETVVRERLFQMRERANELLSTLRELERLFGHNLNITSVIIADRVDAFVEKQLSDLGIESCALSLETVDWSAMIECALERKPPFEKGEAEKGFRDALVLETFMQIAGSAPSSGCQVAFVTEDLLLRDAASQRAEGRRHIRVLANLSDLEGLINTLVSDVPLEWVEKFRPRAAEYFFTQGDETTLFYKLSVREGIDEKCAAHLEAKPAGSARRSNGRRMISAPNFVSKADRRYTWETFISISAQAFAPDAAPASPVAAAPYAGFLRNVQATLDAIAAAQQSPGGLALPDSGPPTWLPAPKAEDKLVAMGETRVRVEWSVTIATNGRFSKGKIESISCEETAWRADRDAD